MRRWTPLVLSLLLLAAIPASGSTFVAMSQDELVAQSDAVVVGEVLKVQSFRDETGRLIVSEAIVQVKETLTGSADSVVVVRTVGGTVDGYTVVAHGFPKFDAGERVVLFLANRDGDTSEVVGYRLGQYKLLVNRRGIEVAVPTLERGVQLLTHEGAPAPRPRALTLDALRSEVRSIQSQRLDGILDR